MAITLTGCSWMEVSCTQISRPASFGAGTQRSGCALPRSWGTRSNASLNGGGSFRSLGYEFYFERTAYCVRIFLE